MIKLSQHLILFCRLLKTKINTLNKLAFEILKHYTILWVYINTLLMFPFVLGLFSLSFVALIPFSVEWWYQGHLYSYSAEHCWEVVINFQLYFIIHIVIFLFKSWEDSLALFPHSILSKRAVNVSFGNCSAHIINCLKMTLHSSCVHSNGFIHDFMGMILFLINGTISLFFNFAVTWDLFYPLW